jgi:hypothetical protein
MAVGDEGFVLSGSELFMGARKSLLGILHFFSEKHFKPPSGWTPASIWKAVATNPV